MLYLLKKYLKQDNGRLKREEEKFLGIRLLQYALKREYGFFELPAIEKGRGGKPWFSGRQEIHFNISHCENGIICGIGNEEIGVDIEMIRPYREALARRICHDKEWETLQKMEDRHRAFTRLWVAKESYLKYTGVGLGCSLREIRIEKFDHDVFKAEGSCFRIREEENFCISVCTAKENKTEFLEVTMPQILYL